MVYSYTPAYYSSLHDSITSICKTILPFSFKKRRIPAIAAAEQRLSKLQSDNLKWQQDSFHQILNLMGLCKEGILAETEVATFRSHLLDTLIASPLDHEQPLILKDKLIFLQELYYAQCITEEEYHSSKRPLLQRLAVQGAEIDAKNIIVGARREKSEEEWSVINLKDEQYILSKENLSSKNKPKQSSAIKQIKGAASVLGLVSSHKHERLKEEKSVFDQDAEIFKPIGRKSTSLVAGKNELGVSQENPFWNCHMRDKESDSQSILMSESLPPEVEKQSGGEKSKRKPFKNLFQKEHKEGHGGGGNENDSDLGKKQWGFNGLKKWMKSDSEDETAPLSLTERSDGETYLGHIVENPIGDGPDTKQIKRKLHADGSSSEFPVDKDLRGKIKRELSRIQTVLNSTNESVQLSNDQIEVISTRLPVDKADLKKFFPKTWCDRYGDVVLDVVRKEFKDHVGEVKNLRNSSVREKQTMTEEWATFDNDDDENYHPNLFATHLVHSGSTKQPNFTPLKDDRVYRKSSTEKLFKNNPFFDY